MAMIASSLAVRPNPAPATAQAAASSDDRDPDQTRIVGWHRELTREAYSQFHVVSLTLG
jgi:hypothetical protein